MSRAGIFASAYVAPASGGSTYRDLVLEDNPFMYFPLDDATTPTDVMGNVTPNQVQSVTMGAAGIGDGATSAQFDGGAASRGIRIPAAQLPNMSTLTSFAAEAIAAADNMSAQRAFFARDSAFLVRHTSAALVDPFTGLGWANRIGASGYPEGAPTAIHHWAIVWDGSTARLYRDGAVVLSEAQAGTPASASTNNLYIGAREATDLTFLGRIAGFAFYTHSLSAARVLAHAQAAGVA